MEKTKLDLDPFAVFVEEIYQHLTSEEVNNLYRASLTWYIRLAESPRLNYFPHLKSFHK